MKIVCYDYFILLYLFYFFGYDYFKMYILKFTPKSTKSES